MLGDMLFIFNSRSCYCPFFRPSALDSRRDRTRFQANSLAPLIGVKSFTHESYFECVFLVSVLLKTCSPSTIIRSVVPVIIFTIKTMIFRRAISHIGMKVGEGFTPPIAHSYPSSTIPSKSFMCGYVTALYCPIPRAELRRVCHAVSPKPVSGIAGCDASARGCVAASKASWSYISLFSALTKACPHCIPFSVWRAFLHGQFAKSTTRKVYEFSRHINISSKFNKRIIT